jgi:parvulin-like peptidyl-prolyl isomerase
MPALTSYQVNIQDLAYEVKMTGKIPDLIQGILRRKIIEYQSQLNNIRSTPEDLQVAADKFRTVNQLTTTTATQQWLQERLLTVEDFEELISHSLLIEKLTHHLFSHKIEHFFHQNIIEYTKASIYEIILQDRELAMEIFYSLEEGDLSFADVAYQYIADPELKRRGGYIGNVNRRQLRPEISAAVFAAKPPQLIQPVSTSMGTHIIKVEEIAQPQLTDEIYQKISIDMFEEWLNPQVIALLKQTSIAL